MVLVYKEFFPRLLRKVIKYLIQIQSFRVRRASFKPEMLASLLATVREDLSELRTVARKEVEETVSPVTTHQRHSGIYADPMSIMVRHDFGSP